MFIHFQDSTKEITGNIQSFSIGSMFQFKLYFAGIRQSLSLLTWEDTFFSYAIVLKKKSYRFQKSKHVHHVLTLLIAVLTFSPALAAPSSDLWPHWQAHIADSQISIDHQAWDQLLKNYLVTDHPSGINRFRYKDVSPKDREKLSNYIKQLQKVKVYFLSRTEQRAFWINLYNALTVKVILDHYPVKSIMDIDISPGLFSNGPWDAKLLVIEEEDVSLNDIEHRILRPIFKDNRLHYAVNCASLGCPNLQPVAFTSSNTEELLQSGAKTYVNSSRGVRVSDKKILVSSIYKWFQIDFGGSDKGVIEHLLLYAQSELAESLRKYNRGLRYDYDWNLNEPEPLTTQEE